MVIKGNLSVDFLDARPAPPLLQVRNRFYTGPGHKCLFQHYVSKERIIQRVLYVSYMGRVMWAVLVVWGVLQYWLDVTDMRRHLLFAFRATAHACDVTDMRSGRFRTSPVSWRVHSLKARVAQLKIRPRQSLFAPVSTTLGKYFACWFPDCASLPHTSPHPPLVPASLPFWGLSLPSWCRAPYYHPLGVQYHHHSLLFTYCFYSLLLSTFFSLRLSPTYTSADSPTWHILRIPLSHWLSLISFISHILYILLYTQPFPAVFLPLI